MMRGLVINWTILGLLKIIIEENKAPRLGKDSSKRVYYRLYWTYSAELKSRPWMRPNVIHSV